MESQTVEGISKTTYRLHSDSHREILVPTEYAKKAQQLVYHAISSKHDFQFSNRLIHDSLLTGVYIPEQVNKLVGTEKHSDKDYDKAYLSICLHLAYNDLSRDGNTFPDIFPKQRLNRLEKINNVETIKRALESL